MKYGKLTWGQMEAIVNKLGGEEGAKEFLRGELMFKHIIDCDRDPFVPEHLEVVEHRKGGRLEWDLNKIELYIDDEQRRGLFERPKGYELRKKMEGMPVLNACVLDYLCSHPGLIPEDWKDRLVFFWGTIFSYKEGDAGVRPGELCVRTLSLVGEEWEGRASPLNTYFGTVHPALLRK